ncbi:MAG: sensor histidine kinase, partial [Oscillospiraceae bacterium]
KPLKIHNIVFDNDFLKNLDTIITDGGYINFDYKYKSYVTYNISVIEGERFLSDINLYRKKGYIIIVTDVTETRNLLEVRQEFFSNASHELKTPITSIIGFSEILINDLVKNKDKEKEYLNKILTNSFKMSNIINDILQISNLDEKKTDEIHSVNVKDIILQVIDDIKPQIKEMNVNVNLNVKSDFNIYINTQNLKDILTNLIENAVKYNKKNGDIFICYEKNGNKMKLSIEDTGIGIDEKYIDRCFERFFIVNKSRHNKFGSTGLGLAIVKNIVNLYNGEIFIDSSLGKGTKITLII